MIKLICRGFEVQKRVALAISRGTQAGSRNWEISIESDGLEGFGESAEFSIPHTTQTFDHLGIELSRAASIVASYEPWQRESIHGALVAQGIASSAIAGIDMAIWDWCGKAMGLPVCKLLGVSQSPSVPTSVTIGIQSPESAQRRWMQWLELGVVRAVKVKMGSPEGFGTGPSRIEFADHGRRELSDIAGHTGISRSMQRDQHQDSQVWRIDRRVANDPHGPCPWTQADVRMLLPNEYGEHRRE